jgi:nicotinamide-nucleotide amidase
MTEGLARRIVDELSERGRTLAVAESCTGGQLAAALTAVPGASRIFPGGIVAYSNEAKLELLGVDWRVLEEHGAVSEETAAQMARGARERFCSDYAIATTGVAGPGGGSELKPVGLVYLAWASASGVRVERRLLQGDRAAVQRQAVEQALAGLWKNLD